jgi:hypothetical protein
MYLYVFSTSPRLGNAWILIGCLGCVAPAKFLVRKKVVVKVVNRILPQTKNSSLSKQMRHLRGDPLTKSYYQSTRTKDSSAFRTSNEASCHAFPRDMASEHKSAWHTPWTLQYGCRTKRLVGGLLVICIHVDVASGFLSFSKP